MLECTCEKLAFANPAATKWTYNVMPFGPVNGLYNCISFVHDMDSTWKNLTVTRGIYINNYNSIQIIVDDILSWAQILATALAYTECQFLVCRSRDPSLSLKKTSVSPKKFEFVGTNVSQVDNRPAMSKHQLVQHLPDPVIVHGFLSRIGFAIFYSSFIPLFGLGCPGCARSHTWNPH